MASLRICRVRRTCTIWPLRRHPSWFGTVISRRVQRVRASASWLMNVVVPVREISQPLTSATTSTFWPTERKGISRSGTSTATLTTLVSTISATVVLRHDRDVLALLDGHIVEHAGHGGDDMSTRQPDAGFRQLRVADRQLRGGGVHVPAGGGPFVDQSLDAVELRLVVLGLGLGHLELGLQEIRVQPDQSVSGLHDGSLSWARSIRRGHRPPRRP